MSSQMGHRDDPVSAEADSPPAPRERQQSSSGRDHADGTKRGRHWEASETIAGFESGWRAATVDALERVRAIEASDDPAAAAATYRRELERRTRPSP